jgi:hypothetical protein
MKQTSTKTESNHHGSFFSIVPFNQSLARKHRYTSVFIEERLSNEISSLFNSSNCLLIFDSNSCFLLRFLQSHVLVERVFLAMAVVCSYFLTFEALINVIPVPFRLSLRSRAAKGRKERGEAESGLQRALDPSEPF